MPLLPGRSRIDENSLSQFWLLKKKSNFALMKAPQNIRLFFERNGFAVTTRLAEVLGMKVKSVRLFFIYASFATLVGGFVLYLTLAFWMKLKDMVYTKRSSVFDL
jgi:phage shock protein PspC (stress-responsive transcriptional regulator)